MHSSGCVTRNSQGLSEVWKFPGAQTNDGRTWDDMMKTVAKLAPGTKILFETGSESELVRAEKMLNEKI